MYVALMYNFWLKYQHMPCQSCMHYISTLCSVLVLVDVALLVLVDVTVDITVDLVFTQPLG